MGKKNLMKVNAKNELSFEDDFDESGFDVAPLGTPVSSFSFCGNVPEVKSFTDSKNNQPSDKLIDNRYGKPAANGAAPPIDGEPFNIKRCFNFRRSTIRKLYELKAKSPDINIYLCTILDAAINYYYKNNE